MLPNRADDRDHQVKLDDETMRLDELQQSLPGLGGVIAHGKPQIMSACGEDMAPEGSGPNELLRTRTEAKFRTAANKVEDEPVRLKNFETGAASLGSCLGVAGCSGFARSSDGAQCRLGKREMERSGFLWVVGVRGGASVEPEVVL